MEDIKMKKVLIILAILSIILISGCDITPENVDVVAKAIQEK